MSKRNDTNLTTWLLAERNRARQQADIGWSNPDLPPVRQRKHIQGVTGGRAEDVGSDQPGHLARAASTVTGRHREVLLAADCERERKALHRSAQASLP